jgi:hypothetical protein
MPSTANQIFYALLIQCSIVAYNTFTSFVPASWSSLTSRQPKTEAGPPRKATSTHARYTASSNQYNTMASNGQAE